MVRINLLKGALKIIYTDDTETDLTFPAVKGDDGKDGKDGKNGKDGINGTVIHYWDGSSAIIDPCFPGDICKDQLRGNEFQLQADGKTWLAVFTPWSKEIVTPPAPPAQQALIWEDNAYDQWGRIVNPPRGGIKPFYFQFLKPIKELVMDINTGTIDLAKGYTSFSGTISALVTDSEGRTLTITQKVNI